MWIVGNDYQNASNYYGAYPRTYLERILSLFPDVKGREILHLFSGSIDADVDEAGYTFDINEENSPHFVGDAETLSTVIPNELKFKLILADPPYSVEDADHYGTQMVNRNTVVSECWKVMPDKGFLVWLDQVLPIYSKHQFDMVGTIGLVRSTNHRVRCVFIFQKKTGSAPMEAWKK